MNLFESFLYYLFGALALFFSSTNVQSDSLPHKRKFLIFTYISFISFFVVPIIGQMSTPFAILGVSVLLIYRQGKKLLNLTCFFLGYFLQVFLDYTYTNSMYRLFHLTIQESHQNSLLLFSICYLPILFILTKLLGWLLHKKWKIDTLFSSGKLSICICINLIASVAILVFGIIYGEKVGYTPQAIFFNGILFSTYFILSNVTFFLAYRTIKKDEQLKAQLEHYENLNSYTQEVERLYHDMRAFKHDYLDILSSMKGYIDKKDMEELTSYFYNSILPVNQHMIDSDSRLGLLSLLEDEAVKSIVSAKLMIAMEQGIHVELELRDQTHITAVDQIDLIRILGIFLNNAVEASLTSVEKELNVAFIKEGEKYIILIRNTTLPLTLPVSALCDKQVTSKEAHSGIGLHTAKNILDAYKNIQWKLDYNMPYFLVEIVIYPDSTY